ncbi:MAG: hypothetical protein IKD78_14060 [Bacteroidales bacterium]|nr:hypothetical protein [Bacteroidales bacterium]MBR6929770.1 hypothetical protein [Bacteroidales bacterium]
MKNEITIAVNTGTVEAPDWQNLDLNPRETYALDFINNLFTDISSITSNRSACTVKIPRTRRNDRIFDCAYNPSYSSKFPYRYHECRCRINDIDVTGKAYMYLLDMEGGNYRIAIVFGLMQNCKKWVEENPSLRQLPDNKESIQWDWQAAYNDGPHAGMPDPWAPIWHGDDAASYAAHNGLSKAMYFGIYSPGFPLTWPEVLWANVHPFVTLREIWERITAANNLRFVLPSDVERDMEDVALVLTKIDGNIPSGTPTIHTTQISSPHLMHRPPYRFWFHLNEEGYFDTATNLFNRVFSQGNAPVTLNINIVLENYQLQGLSNLIHYVGGNMNRLKMKIVDTVSNTKHYITPVNTGTTDSQLFYSGQVTLDGSEVNGAFIGYLMVEIEPTNYQADWVTVEEYLRDISATGSVQYITYENSVNYPNDFLLIPNLPDISQLEFVKAICGMYCLFPVIRNADDETVEFVRFDTFDENKMNAYDWSNKLLESDPDAPKIIDYKTGLFAKKNRIAYKTDNKENVTSEAFIEVDDDTLDDEKDLIVFPWAASNGNIIKQYNIVKESDTSTEPPTETYKVEFTECEYRLMRVQEWYDPIHKKVTHLSFYDLSPEYLITQYYGTYIGISTETKALKENIMLNEIDLKTMDFTRPVYLRKYGQFFAVKSIRWNIDSHYSEVELIKLD